MADWQNQLTNQFDDQNQSTNQFDDQNQSTNQCDDQNQSTNQFDDQSKHTLIIQFLNISNKSTNYKTAPEQHWLETYLYSIN